MVCICNMNICTYAGLFDGTRLLNPWFITGGTDSGIMAATVCVCVCVCVCVLCAFVYGVYI